jgi:hypothetical protein
MYMKCAGKGTAGPHRHVDGGAVQAHSIDGGAWTAWRRGEGDDTIAYRRSQRRRRPNQWDPFNATHGTVPLG